MTKLWLCLVLQLKLQTTIATDQSNILSTQLGSSVNRHLGDSGHSSVSQGESVNDLGAGFEGHHHGGVHNAKVVILSLALLEALRVVILAKNIFEDYSIYKQD